MSYYQFQGPVQGSFDDDEMRRRRRHHGVEPIPQAPQQPAALQGPQPMTQQEMEAAWQGPPVAGPYPILRGLAADRREFEDEDLGPFGRGSGCEVLVIMRSGGQQRTLG